MVESASLCAKTKGKAFYNKRGEMMMMLVMMVENLSYPILVRLIN